MNNPKDPIYCPNYWFKRHGMDGSYQARERLFRALCPTKGQYQGTAQQNTLLFRMLKERFGP